MIHGKFDSDYANFPHTRKSISGCRAFLYDTVVTVKSLMQRIAALSISESKLFSETKFNQDILCMYRLINNIVLKIKPPITIGVDNQWAVDLANKWSVVGRTLNVEVPHYFLREMKW